MSFCPHPALSRRARVHLALHCYLKIQANSVGDGVLAKHAGLTRYWCPDKRNILKYYNLWALEYQLSFLWENLSRKWGWFLKTKYWLCKTVDNSENWKLMPRILGAGRRGRRPLRQDNLKLTPRILGAVRRRRRPLRQDNLKLITIYLNYKW